MLEAIPLPLAGLTLLQPTVHQDERGFLIETWNERRLAAAGIAWHFVQDNHSRSIGGTLRGLHYQRFGGEHGPGQAKLVRVARGRIWDVAVDLRRDSVTFGRWHAIELDDEDHRQLFIPGGFAHGFCVLSDVADVSYKLSTFYDPMTECGIAWDDPELAIPWPVVMPLLSPRDRANTSLSALRASSRDAP